MKTKKIIIGALSLGITFSSLVGCAAPENATETKTENNSKPTVILSKAAQTDLTAKEQDIMLSDISFEEDLKTWDEEKINQRRKRNIKGDVLRAIDIVTDLPLAKSKYSNYQQFRLAYTGTFMYTEDSREVSEKILKPILDLKQELLKQFPDSNSVSREREYDDNLRLNHLEGQRYSYSMKIAYTNWKGSGAKTIHFEISGELFYNYTSLEAQFVYIKLKQLD